MPKIVISTHVRSTRLDYVCDFVFNEVLDLDYSFRIDPTLTNEFHIDVDSSTETIKFPNTGLLHEKGINRLWQATMTNDLQNLFNDSTVKWQHYDVFGIIFFLLSRYEEYIESARDQHDRFMALSSCLFHAGCIEIPVVDRLIHFLKNEIEQQASISIETKPSEFISTIDVDFPWYRKHLKFPYYLRKEKLINKLDPFDTHDEIISLHEKIAVQPIFFFLIGGSPPYEKIKNYDQAEYSSLIKKITQKAKIGIHPPYQAATDATMMSKAFNDFKSLSGTYPSLSRQHYLRVKLPTTYRLLIQQGIKEDFSLGFADRVGFRAGTAHSFYWYDLKQEQQTSLRLHPLIAMDVTLKHYMKLQPTVALNKLNELKNTIETYGGNMTLLWHNSSLSHLHGWSKYREVYFKFISQQL